MKNKKGWRPYRVGRTKNRTGLGLYATAFIKKKEFIIEYVGKKIPTSVADELGTKYLFELNKKWTIDGSKIGNVARYINHACRPNAESDIVKGKIIIRAIKDIQPGDEITYHYGKEYFDEFIKPGGCKCASCVKRRAASEK